MATSTVKRPGSTNRALEAAVVLSVVGMTGLAMTVLIGFEEPNNTLLLFSTILALAAPAAMLVHLSVTKELTRQEKRIWIQELTGPRAPWVFSEYLTCHDRRAIAERFVEEARRRPNARAGRARPR